MGINMKKIALILISIIIASNVYAHEKPRDKIVFGKKCTLNEEGIKVSSYIWVVQKDMEWQKKINKKNCKE